MEKYWRKDRYKGNGFLINGIYRNHYNRINFESTKELLFEDREI